MKLHSRDLFLWGVIAELDFTNLGLLLPDSDTHPTVQPRVYPDSSIRLCLRTLHPSRADGPMGPHRLEIHRGGDHLDVGQGELGASGDDLTVERDHRCTVIVQPVAVTTLLIGI